MLIRMIAILLLLPLTAAFSQLKDLQTKFTRTDTLRGMLTPLRTCYDVTHYNLDVKIDPATQSISGSNTITFKTVTDFTQLQVDLFDNLMIDKIEWKGKTLSFTRELNAVFVTFPETVKKNSVQSIKISYNGKPTVAKYPPWDGGFIWATDATGKPWVAVACQGFGASSWWPNKDHQSDEPDSMMISITVPKGLTDISNGRLRKVTELKDWTRYDWAVTYPINNYNVTFNVGEFAHFSDKHGDLALDYYVMPENEKKAREQFKQVHGMMDCFEKYFGPYPFKRDGYKLVESPHLGMEHQSAVAYGNKFLNGYKGYGSSPEGIKFDFIIIHESAHEWWGNSVTSKDLADMWIHESFGAYAEAVYAECMWGNDAGQRYVNGKKQDVKFDAPIIGTYNVNSEGSGDMYPKGALMLNTLRHVVNNDSTWWAIVRGIATTFQYKTITTEDIVAYVNQQSKMDLTYIFDQYLRHAPIPTLVITLMRKGNQNSMSYQWKADVADFHMPARVTLKKDQFELIYPTKALQTITLGDINFDDFKVDQNSYFINVKIVKLYFDENLKGF